MEALVTGANGFLGRRLAAELLARGHRVRGLARRRDSQLEAMGVRWLAGDVRDAQLVATACAGCDVVFHTAGVAGIWGAWDHFYGINTLGTKNVVDACVQQGVRRLVYTSSPSVTFDGRDQCGIDESAPYPSRWLCHYSHSKALAEQLVLQANGQGQLLTCALRPHLIWGPGDRHLIPRLLARAKAGRLRRVGDGRNLIDMIYVDNAAEAHLLAAEALEPGSPACGRPYFISQGQPVNCWQWIDQILTLAGLPPVRRAMPYGLAWTAGAMLELVYRLLGIGQEPLMTRFLAAQLAKSHYFDIRRAREDLGYWPTVSTEEGMRRLGEELAGRTAGAGPLVNRGGNG